jgi:hypothetical protein
MATTIIRKAMMIATNKVSLPTAPDLTEDERELADD